MKYLIWNECYVAGGADWSIIELIMHWPNDEDAFTVFVNDSHEGKTLLTSKLGEKVNFVSYFSPQDISKKIIAGQTWFKKIFRVLLLFFLSLYFCLFKMFSYILKERPDVLIVNNGGYPGALSNYLVVFVAYIFRVSNIVMIVRNYPVKTYEDSIYIKSCSFLCNHLLDGIVTVSNSLKNALNKDANISFKKIKTIYNGVSLDNKLSEDNEKKYGKINDYSAAIIGTLDERKGHIYLLKAWVIVVQSYPGAVLYIAGKCEGENFKQLYGFVSENGLNNNIEWIGFQNNIGHIYEKVSIVVVPSVEYESFGRVAAESLAFKKPVIVNNAGGLCEIINNDDVGICIDTKNTQLLANKIIELFSDEALRQKIALTGYERYNNSFTAEIMAENYYEYLNDI